MRFPQGIRINIPHLQEGLLRPFIASLEPVHAGHIVEDRCILKRLIAQCARHDAQRVLIERFGFFIQAQIPVGAGILIKCRSILRISHTEKLTGHLHVSFRHCHQFLISPGHIEGLDLFLKRTVFLILVHR